MMIRMFLAKIEKFVMFSNIYLFTCFRASLLWQAKGVNIC